MMPWWEILLIVLVSAAFVAALVAAIYGKLKGNGGCDCCGGKCSGCDGCRGKNSACGACSTNPKAEQRKFE